jgi:hypothetical protein
MNGTEPLELVLRLAAQEAVTAGYREITPAHLLIALSRLQLRRSILLRCGMSLNSWVLNLFASAGDSARCWVTEVRSHHKTRFTVHQSAEPCSPSPRRLPLSKGCNSA